VEQTKAAVFDILLCADHRLQPPFSPFDPTF
jgi:hypothetical protein